MVHEARLELARASSLAPKARVSTIPPLMHTQRVIIYSPSLTARRGGMPYRHQTFNEVVICLDLTGRLDTTKLDL